MAGWRRLAGTVALVLAAACGGSQPAAFDDAPAVARYTVEVDGVERTYRLFTPPADPGDPPMPLVLALHGSGNTADSFGQASRLDEAASAGPFVVAYPEAVRLLWNGGRSAAPAAGATRRSTSASSSG